ncbi:hypothetical protein HWHPT5561_05000 [Petrotoga sp. HWH.PT.55.6.1]|uniref:DUF6115 domain-containing protein n=1 Tax=unclassified Petrotoga TaxID=2620614 RepID=UPI000CA07819|nr:MULTISPECIES: DUF6115 domain-containing protein [unclassified Petrotoga]PNR87763.1 hypothetical protein X925_08435 [Petrotoga sp. 9T1HF07.CasAA.8.2]PNR92208.1 hypothetical protein X926_06635 [Petrotoga sp. HWHPT.55.6.3]RPD35825.1 hypothetical protein HWHPT5561_05000 [Petrotoga sp. HWH.PT.55.6.1]
MVILYLLVVLSLTISIVNIFLMIRLGNFLQENNETGEKYENFEEEKNLYLARFQKITSTRLRALDNKIELVDQLMKDLDDAYAKTFSLLTDLERKLDSYKRQEIETKVQNTKNLEDQKDNKNQKETVEKDDRLRVYELSRKLNISSKKLVDFINTNTDLDVSNHLVKLTPEEEKMIFEKIKEVPNISSKKENIPSNIDMAKDKNINISKDNVNYKYDKTNKILELSKNGYTPQEIAKELKIGVGEIMLVLSLFNNEEK